MARKGLRQRALAGETVVGAMIFEFFTPGLPQILQNAGCEFVLYDMEHTGATFETIRRMFIKVAVRVEELKGKIKLAFPASYPQAAMLAVMTGAITTRGP